MFHCESRHMGYKWMQICLFPEGQVMVLEGKNMELKVVEDCSQNGSQEATLASIEVITPFSIGLISQQVFGSSSIYNPECLTPLRSSSIILPSVGCLKCHHPILLIASTYSPTASTPHSVTNGYKWVLALSMETFSLAEKVKAFLAASLQPSCFPC
ncbi:60S acidic ribosomal protein P0, partial [Galemys pyrenaicus]